MKKITNPVTVLMGAGGIKEAYLRTLGESRVDFICLAKNYGRIIGDFYNREYAPRLFGSKIKTREVLPDSRENRESASEKDAGKNQVRFVRGGGNESDVILTPRFAVLVSYNPESPLAVVIEDRELVNTLRRQFTAMFESAQK